jgi:hypothetical protein
MTQVCAAETSVLDGYEAHSGIVTLVLAALTVASLHVANAGHPLAAAGLYALTLVVAIPLLTTELGTFYDWLRA